MPDIKLCSTQRVPVSWKENMETRAAVAERLGTSSGRALPKAVYGVLPAVISCEVHNVPAAGIGTSPGLAHSHRGVL